MFFLTLHDKLENQIGAMQNMAEEAGYSTSDLGIYIQPVVQGTSYHCEFNLFYDPDNVKERNRVQSLSSQATKNLMALGAFFSRPYGENAGMVLNRDAATVAVLNKLKNIVDPNHIMNPGKICF